MPFYNQVSKASVGVSHVARRRAHWIPAFAGMTGKEGNARMVAFNAAIAICAGMTGKDGNQRMRRMGA